LYLFTVMLTLFLLFPSVWGHAKLTSPLPWAIEESQDLPCGGPNYENNSLPYAQWVIGSNTSIGWIIADPDGDGQVVLTFETVPTNMFTVPSTLHNVSLPNITWAVKDYTLNFMVPNITCTGPNNTCVVRTLDIGEGMWTDCTTVRVIATGENMLLQPHGGNAQCAQAYPLQCVNAQYRVVSVPAGYTLESLSDAVDGSFALLNDPQHVTTPNTLGCNTSLLNFLCAKYFQMCNDPGICHTVCTQAICLCGVKNTQDLEDDWDCANATKPLDNHDLNGPCTTKYNPQGLCFSAAPRLVSSFFTTIVVGVILLFL